jgi:hypothetical protein
LSFFSFLPFSLSYFPSPAAPVAPRADFPEATITNIVEMGFPRDQVRMCLNSIPSDQLRLLLPSVRRLEMLTVPSHISLTFAAVDTDFQAHSSGSHSCWW